MTLFPRYFIAYCCHSVMYLFLIALNSFLLWANFTSKYNNNIREINTDILSSVQIDLTLFNSTCFQLLQSIYAVTNSERVV